MGSALAFHSPIKGWVEAVLMPRTVGLNARSMMQGRGKVRLGTISLGKISSHLQFRVFEIELF